MQPVFDSHQFILELARLNQAEYVRALYAYLDPEADGVSKPFKVTPGILSKKLSDFPELVVLIRFDKPSAIMFGNTSECAGWRKVESGLGEGE